MADFSSSSPPHNKLPVFARKREVIFVGILLLAALAMLLVWIWARPSGAKAMVMVGQNSEQTSFTVSLNDTQTLQVDGLLPVTLQVENGSIRFINSHCPDHDCEGFGWLSHEGDWALCAPAQVMVQVVQGS